MKRKAAKENPTEPAVQIKVSAPTLHDISRYIPDAIAVRDGGRAVYGIVKNGPKIRASRLGVGQAHEHDIRTGEIVRTVSVDPVQKVEYMWRQAVNAANSPEILLVLYGKNPLREGAVRDAIYYAEHPEDSPEARRKKEFEKGRGGSAWNEDGTPYKPKRKNLDLDDVVGFGKHGPHDGEPGKTIRQIIAEDLSWIGYMMRQIGRDFLTREARDTYYATLKAKRRLESGADRYK